MPGRNEDPPSGRGRRGHGSRGGGRGSAPTRDDGRPEVTDIRKVRSPHGTRVHRKVTCSKCGAEDTIHFAPKPGQNPLCRRCAAELLGVTDRDASIVPESREKCDRCGLFVPKVCTFEDPLDCREHARALAMKQSERSKTGTRSRNGNVIRTRRGDG